MSDNRKAIALLDEVLAEDSGCDEAAWKRLQQSIEDNRMSYRKRFRPPASTHSRRLRDDRTPDGP